MSIVALKLLETFVRALFIVVTTYALHVEELGQFGLIVTLVGLFSFLFGFERQIDLQRKLVGQPAHLFDGKLEDALWLFVLNYVLTLPVFAVLMLVWLKLPLGLVLACVTVVVGEHLANQSYQMALISHRHRHLVLIVTLKNSALFLYVAFVLFVVRAPLTLAGVLYAWSVVSVGSVCLLGAMWIWVRDPSHRGQLPTFGTFTSQYRASYNHFLIGLIAILSIQMDRLVAGAVLRPTDVGLYFRHVLLTSLVYQLFNIASFNRILPRIFQLARTEPAAQVRPVIWSEYKRVLAASALMYVGAVIAGEVPGIAFFHRYHIRPEFLALLFVAFLLRAGADLNGILLNGKGRERRILIIQTTALAVGVAVYASLAITLGITGAMFANLAAPATYLLLSRRELAALEKAEA